MKPTITFLLLALCASALAQPAPLPISTPEVGRAVTLAWNASPSAGVDGYRIYWGGLLGIYTNSVTVGAVTTATLTGLPTPVYFVCRAFNAEGESDSSNMAAVLGNVTDVTWIAQTNSTPSGTFKDAFPVMTQTNVSGVAFVKLRGDVKQRLATLP